MALGFGFNKAKVLAAAEKFVQQGKLPNAIAEYEKITREDPKDLTVLNTIGDLYARVGENERAAHYFRKVGEQYAQNGFTVKAIAIHKKLTNLVPPTLGFFICLLLWLNLSRPAKMAGTVWMAVGIAFGAWKTKGFRSNLVDFELPPEES